MVSSIYSAGSKTLEGRIVGIEDEEGNTTGLQISVSTSKPEDEEEEYETYLIEMTGKGLELAEFIYEMVKVTGQIKKDKEGNQILVISSYSIIPEIEELDDSSVDMELE